MDNVFSPPLPGTTLRTITEEWEALSGFHSLMRQRMKLEAEHLLQLRQFQKSINPNWSKSGVWALISPVVELWSSQIDILEECSTTLNNIFDSCPTEPSPDEFEQGVTPYFKYTSLQAPYEAYQECQKVASSREAITEMQSWLEQNQSKSQWFHDLKPFPLVERNYRESVIAQQNTLRQVTEWHATKMPETLDGHVRHVEEMQRCVRDYLVESSKFMSDLVKSISTAQKRLADFSSLAFIDRSHKCFENESRHPYLQPAVYLNHCLGVPAVPVLGVLSYIPKLLEVKGEDGLGYWKLYMGHVLEMEKESASFDEMIQKLKDSRWGVEEVALYALGPFLPVGEEVIRRYTSGIKRDEIALVLKPFPVENCRMAATVIIAQRHVFGSYLQAKLIFGTTDAWHLFEDFWRKWDFDNHRPLPSEVVRNLPKWNNKKGRFEGGELVFKKTGLPYKPSQ